MPHSAPDPHPRGAASRAPEDEHATEQPIVRAASVWLTHLARTVKTSRLYDRGNAASVGMREELARALDALLTEHGPLRLEFSPQEIRIGEVPVYSSPSREDNLVLPFFRDGIRTLALLPGFTAREVEGLLDALLEVTRHQRDDRDLVSLLWDCSPEHLEMQYVTTDGDIEGGAGAESEAPAGSIAPWPDAKGAGGSEGEGAAAAGAPRQEPIPDRSDDRFTHGSPADFRAALEALAAVAPAESERLRREYEEECATPIPRAALRLARDCIAGSRAAEQRATFGSFLARIFLEAAGQGMWREAREVVALFRQPGLDDLELAGVIADLGLPNSATTAQAIAALDRQNASEHETLFELLRDLGPDATDWAMRMVAGSQRQAVRTALTGVIAEIAAPDPERLAPWLADPRWFVARNAVHVLGRIAGGATVGLLRAASQHSEFRVRREVVWALAQADRERAWPVLDEMLDRADGRLLGIILHQLAHGANPSLARKLLGYLESPQFEERPEEQRRAILQTLAAVGGDQELPALESRLHSGTWFARTKDEARFAIAMCIARFGTPAARDVLERGARHKRGEIARVCAEALAGFRPREERKAA